MNYIISLGGSIISREAGIVGTKFLKRFRATILAQAKAGHQFIIIPGGGQLCRLYQKAARGLGALDNMAVDWIGIAANCLHSYLLLAIFGAKAHPQMITLDNLPRHLARPIGIALGGLRPGGSSDTTSVEFARRLKIKTIINLTDVAGVYDRDPKKFPRAKLVPRMSWQEFARQFGLSRKPGQNLPFDSSASLEAKKLKLRVIIMDGRNLRNFQNFLANKHFSGTVIGN